MGLNALCNRGKGHISFISAIYGKCHGSAITNMRNMDVALPYSLLSFSSAHRITFFTSWTCLHTCAYVCWERERMLCAVITKHTALSNVDIHLGAAWSYMRLTCLSTEKPWFLLSLYEQRNSLTAHPNLCVCWIHFHYVLKWIFSLYGCVQ